MYINKCIFKRAFPLKLVSQKSNMTQEAAESDITHAKQASIAQQPL